MDRACDVEVSVEEVQLQNIAVSRLKHNKKIILDSKQYVYRRGELAYACDKKSNGSRGMQFCFWVTKYKRDICDHLLSDGSVPYIESGGYYE